MESDFAAEIDWKMAGDPEYGADWDAHFDPIDRIRIYEYVNDEQGSITPEKILVSQTWRHEQKPYPHWVLIEELYKDGTHGHPDGNF